MVRRNLGWNKTEDTWCKAALTSQATLRRFWAQNRIRCETFIDICKAVGINKWEDIIERNDINKTELLLAAAIADIPQDNQTDRTFPLPENLPPVRNWVQRTKEIDTLKTLITAPPLTNESPAPAPPLPSRGGGVPIAISIVGLPGIGKTTLVSQLIHQLHTENTPFTCAAWQSLQSATGKAPPAIAQLTPCYSPSPTATLPQPSMLKMTVAKKPKTCSKSSEINLACSFSIAPTHF